MEDIYTVSHVGRSFNIRLEMLNTRRLSQMFQIPQDSIYLLNRSNVAVFPDESGQFPADHLGPPNGTFTVQGGPQVDESSQSHAFSFSANNSTPRASPSTPGFMFRSSSTARGQRSNFTRKIFRGVIQGKTISPSGSYHISLNCDTCNTADVVRITKEVANIDTELVLADSSGFEIVDSVATRGIEYWKTPARKFFVVTRDEYRALMVARNPTRKRQADDLSEVDDKLAQIINNAKRLWVPDVSTVRTIQETFSCAICKHTMQQPVFSSCCESILGCRDCLARVDEQCPKCRSNEVQYTPVRGLDSVISALEPVMNMTLSSQDNESS